MLQNQTDKPQVFRNSLRNWQANYKARQQLFQAVFGDTTQEEAPTTEAPQAQPEPETATKPRVKRLVSRRRKRRQTANV